MKHNITDSDGKIRKDIVNWLNDTFDISQFEVDDIGFIYENYVVKFNDPKAEMLYLLRWS